MKVATRAIVPYERHTSLMELTNASTQDVTDAAGAIIQPCILPRDRRKRKVEIDCLGLAGSGEPGECWVGTTCSEQMCSGPGLLVGDMVHLAVELLVCFIRYVMFGAGGETREIFSRLVATLL